MNPSTGDAHWVFESQDRGNNGTAPQNLTDKRFFWLALYAQPGLWIGLAIFAVVRLENPIWLSLVGKYHSFISPYPTERKQRYIEGGAQNYIPSGQSMKLNWKKLKKLPI